MKSKLIALSLALAGLSGIATAAPVLQTCASMEVTHNSNIGLSYSLSCEAGDWHLKYTGSIPSGNEPVAAQYRLDVARPDGTSFTMNRTVNTPAPAHLGRMLVREAVLLDSGELALRDCKEFACTLYRPVGIKGSLAKSTITVTPEVKRLTDERAALAEALKQRTTQLKEQTTLVELQLQNVGALERQLADVQAQLKKATADYEATLAKAASAHDAEAKSLKEQAERDVARLTKESKDAQAAADSEWNAKLSSALNKADGEWGAKLAAMAAQRDSALESIKNLTAELAAAQDALKKQDAVHKDVIGGLEKVNAEISDELEKVRGQLDAANKAAESTKAYEFAIKDLVEQHNAQLAAVRQALPDTNFNGLLQELSIPKVVGAPNETAKAPVAEKEATPKAEAPATPTKKPVKAKLLKTKKVGN